MMVHAFRLLRWQYLGRLTLAAGIFGGALLVWRTLAPTATLLVTLVLVVSLAITLPSYWYTHIAHRAPGETFLYLQAIYDALLVTAIVHVTGGAESDFAPLYILVIAEASLLLPLPGSVLIGGLASILYVADLVWLHEPSPPGVVFVQIGLFAIMALVTGALGERLRKTGSALGAVEGELRRLRLDTGDILGTMDTGVVTVDRTGRLTYVNPAAERLLELSGDEWLGRPVLEWLDRRAPGLGTAMRRSVETRVPIRRDEVPLPGGDGTRVLGIRTTLLEREDEPQVTAVFQDITDSRRVEELNRRAERLEAVAGLAASLAHEIKNPLASIRSAVEQLAAEELGSEDRRRLDGLVRNESDRLSRLLSEFIEFSRVQLQRTEPVDLDAVVRQALDLVAEHPDADGGATVEYVPPPEPIRVPGDEDLLHRAVFNLALNAVQHSPPDGTVAVEVRRVDEATLPRGVAMDTPVRVVVRDSGPGIPVEEVSRVFDPFFTRRRGGTGLGLALVHRAVEAHHGAVFVDDAPGGGTRFTVYLPAHVEETVPA
ncbi:MAG: two-component system sensor histidine kinase NtrB [Gemmatimonadota bacterium]